MVKVAKIAFNSNTKIMHQIALVNNETGYLELNQHKSGN